MVSTSIIVAIVNANLFINISVAVVTNSNIDHDAYMQENWLAFDYLLN